MRWHGRFELEAKGLELAESQLALAALAALPGDEAGIAIEALSRIGAVRGVYGLDSLLKRLGSRPGRT